MTTERIDRTLVCYLDDAETSWMSFECTLDGAVLLNIVRNNRNVPDSYVMLAPQTAHTLLTWLIEHGVGRSIIE